MTKKASWKDILADVPEADLFAEVQRRRSAKRKTRSGGVVWGHHNPKTAACRCEACNARRKAALDAATELAYDAYAKGKA